MVDRAAVEHRVPAPIAFSIEAGTVYGVLLNFRSALASLGDAVHKPPYQKPPVAPVLYIKPRNCRIGPQDPIPVPEGADALLMGGTIGLVIGSRATRVKEDAALGYIGALTLANDVSLPETSYFRPPLKQRCRDGFLPMGPHAAARETLARLDRLTVRTLVNGELLCEASLSELVRPVPRLLADVTEFLTLSPGDVILIGTPGALPLARAGDRVRIESDGIGALENPLVAEQDLEPTPEAGR